MKGLFDKRIDYTLLDPLVLELAAKHKLTRAQVRVIWLSQFILLKEVITSDNMLSIKLIKIGNFYVGTKGKNVIKKRTNK